MGKRPGPLVFHINFGNPSVDLESYRAETLVNTSRRVKSWHRCITAFAACVNAVLMPALTVPAALILIMKKCESTRSCARVAVPVPRCVPTVLQF